MHLSLQLSKLQGTRSYFDENVGRIGVKSDTLGNSTLASTEFIHANGSVTSGPNLPEARRGHCMVTLHDSKVMIIGGYSHSSVLVFNTADNSYTTGPSMSYSRGSPACTLFHSDLHNGRPVVLAAGGSYETTIEVYDYTNSNQWETSIHLNISNM